MTLDTKSASLFSRFSFCMWLLMRTALTESFCCAKVQLHREGAGKVCRVNENVAELSLGSSSRCLGLGANLQVSHAWTIFIDL